MAGRRYSLAEVRASYTEEKAWAELEGEFPAWLIYRPLSFPVSWLFLRLRVPILAVTLSSGVLALLMTFVAFSGGPAAPYVVALLGFVFHVFDCVDGNMARTTRQSSEFGALVDGTIDMAFWCLLFLSTGLLVHHRGGGIFGDHAIAVGLGLAVLVLLNRLVRDTFATRFSSATYFRAEIPEKLSVGDLAMIGFVGLENLYVFGIAIGAAFGAVDHTLAAMAVYVVLIFVGAMVMTFRKAWALRGGA